jgi:hypothetical protein
MMCQQHSSASQVVEEAMHAELKHLARMLQFEQQQQVIEDQG